ncbi:hypothetical protein I3U40_18185 [Mycobacteroides abscessus subsp. abscessus]|uniref:hypothetical protein n=1 Tax=Mycobacteroides abscessus TaxID=36809 RepID=UPI0009A5D0CA|nr:hypothetical protein [Mycobacteroides abscessus]QSM92986.1 hypothetical protein I3U31_18175 [Mycobacteroides abscessus subsp. abscessus]QSM98024.1 hypothetical protein I3U40_18185 [Mycobacteroides abscessus subsp. abscessus]SLI40983.1 FtsK/SpoIIIE family protein [Mycobacteroides abscessus subsp. abscessus]
MGFFDTYQPTERERWAEQQRRDRDRVKAENAAAAAARREQLADATAAVRAREAMRREEMAAAEKQRKIESDAAAAAEKVASDAEKSALTRPVIKRVGGTDGNAKSVMVWHWKVEPPKNAGLNGARRPGAGVLLKLPRGGGLVFKRDSFIYAVKNRTPDVLTDHPEWAKATRAALADVRDRYADLFRVLRDDREMGKLFYAADVTMDKTTDAHERGRYGVYTRKVTTRSVPTLVEVMVGIEGLELVYEHRSGDSAKRWNSKLDTLRSAFAAMGADAANMKVEDTATGDIRVAFRDAPNVFPRAVASTPVPFPKTEAEAVAAYPDLHWRFGVDARGGERSARILDASHIAIVAKTNWGKSILAASLLENLRPYGSWMVFDGKGSDHSAKMAEEPGVTWISKTAAQHLLGMKWLHEEMHERIAAADEALAAGADKATAFSFPPIFGLLDEIPSMRQRIEELLGADALAKFDRYVEDILQLGRQARIHLVLVAQSLYVASFPTEWQKNVSRMVFLGPVAARSMVSDEIPKDVADAVEFMSARIPDSAKGRATLLEKSDSGAAPVQVQTYFDWAPGSTSMAMAPTAEVAAAWEKQRANLEGRPLLFDRIGLQVEDAEWARLPLKELLDIPTVIVADEHGVVEGMEKYDLLSPHFAGKAAAATLNPSRARGRGSVVSAASATPSPAPAAPSPAGDDELLAALAEAQRRGLIPSPKADAESKPTDSRGGGAF